MTKMEIKKNILDLKYQKFLQFYVVTVIGLITYFIGIIIALLTKQINIRDYSQIFLILLISSLVLGMSIFIMIEISNKLTKIIEEIKRLSS